MKNALAGMAETLRQNPEMLNQQVAMFKTFFPGANESVIKQLIEKTADPNFNPASLRDEVANLVSAVNSKTQENQ